MKCNLSSLWNRNTAVFTHSIPLFICIFLCLKSAAKICVNIAVKQWNFIIWDAFFSANIRVRNNMEHSFFIAVRRISSLSQLTFQGGFKVVSVVVLHLLQRIWNGLRGAASRVLSTFTHPSWDMMICLEPRTAQGTFLANCVQKWLLLFSYRPPPH